MTSIPLSIHEIDFGDCIASSLGEILGGGAGEAVTRRVGSVVDLDVRPRVLNLFIVCFIFILFFLFFLFVVYCLLFMVYFYSIFIT